MDCMKCWPCLIEPHLGGLGHERRQRREHVRVALLPRDEDALEGDPPGVHALGLELGDADDLVVAAALGLSAALAHRRGGHGRFG